MPERAATWDALPPAVRDQHDDLFVGEITRPETLAGLCDGIDVVFFLSGADPPEGQLDLPPAER